MLHDRRPRACPVCGDHSERGPWRERASARAALAAAVLADPSPYRVTVALAVRNLADVLADPAAPPGVTRGALLALADVAAAGGVG